MLHTLPSELVPLFIFVFQHHLKEVKWGKMWIRINVITWKRKKNYTSVQTDAVHVHHAHVWKRTLRWPSWLLFSPPARPASALSHPELFWHGQVLPQLPMRPPSCLPCCLGQGCAAPGYEMPYLQLFLQLAETKIDMQMVCWQVFFHFSLNERSPIILPKTVE